MVIQSLTIIALCFVSIVTTILRADQHSQPMKSLNLKETASCTLGSIFGQIKAALDYDIEISLAREMLPLEQQNEDIKSIVEEI